MILRLFKTISHDLFDCLMMVENEECIKRNMRRLKTASGFYLDLASYTEDPEKERNFAYWNLLNRKYKIL